MTFEFVSSECSVVNEYRICRMITHHSPLTTHINLPLIPDISISWIVQVFWDVLYTSDRSLLARNHSISLFIVNKNIVFYKAITGYWLYELI